MHLEFTDDQLELRDSVRSVLSHECPPRLVREVVETGSGADRLWQQMVFLGWPALTLDDELGGLGQGFIELAVVMEELGRSAAPGPFLATTTQFLPAIRHAGTPAQVRRFLGPMAAGELRGTLAVNEGSQWDASSIAATARRDGEGWVLSGAKQHVLSGMEADEVVVAARRDDGLLGLFVVPAAELVFTPITSFDASRPVAHVQLDGVWVPDARLLGEPDADGDAALAATLWEATVGIALDTIGACQTIFDTTLAYARQREQFGAPIGSFQVTKHKFADMLVALEKARVTAYFAALTIAEEDERAPLAVSMAKAAAGDCQRLIAHEGIQIHGGIGYTWEHDIHIWVKRAKAGELLFGTSAHHRRIVGDHLFHLTVDQAVAAAVARRAALASSSE